LLASKLHDDLASTWSRDNVNTVAMPTIIGDTAHLAAPYPWPIQVKSETQG